MKKDKNWFSVNRSVLQSDLWLSEKFTRGQAWIDLLGLANHKDGYIRVRGNRIPIKRGQVGYSVEKLRERWSWSKRKTNDWFEELIDDQQIEQHKSYTTSVITIINYEKYQGNAPAELPADCTAELPADSPLTIRKNKENKVNKKNTTKKFKPPTLEEIKEFMKEKDITSFTAESFFYHYESNGWMVGSKKMKSWTSAIHKWNHNPRNNSKSIKKEPTREEERVIMKAMNIACLRSTPTLEEALDIIKKHKND